MMKLYYITRVDIPSYVAQSVQISSMCKSFNNQIDDFKLISPKNKNNIDFEEDFKWEKINIKTRFKYFEFLIKAVLIVLKEKPSHIFTRDIVIAFALSLFSIKVTYEAHKEPKTKVAKFLIFLLKNKKNFFLVTISNALKIFYCQKYKYSPSKVLDCHDAVFVDKYDDIRKSTKEELRKILSLPNDKIIIMHTGSLYKGRGAELFKIIIDNFNDILFVQVGGNEKDIKRYERFYANYNNILFVGHQSNENLIKYQMSADLLFYPMTENTSTYWCCSPMKIFEYMASGVPILSSNVGSVSEVLNNSNSIPFNSEESIIEGVVYFLINKQDGEYKAKKALNDVRLSFTWNKRVKKIIGYIK